MANTVAPNDEHDPPYPSTFYAWYCVFILLGIYLNSFLDRSILGLLVEDMRSTMNLSDTQMGFLMGPAFAVFYTVAGLPLGWLADRMSRRWLIMLGQAFWSLASVFFGMSRNFGQMVATRIGVGVGEASLSPSAYSFIADLFPPHKLGRALSVYAMGIYMGGGLASLLGGLMTNVFPAQELHPVPIAGERYGWQIVFFLVAAPTIPLSLLLLTIRDPTRRGVTQVKDASGKVRVAGVSMGTFRRYWFDNKRTMLCHNVGFSLLSFAGYGASAWLPAFFIRLHGWTPAQAGAYLGLNAMIAGPAGLLSAGSVADYLSRKGYMDSKMRVGLFAALCWLPLGIALPLMPNGTLAFLLLIPATFMSAMPWGIAPAAIQEVMPNQMRGQASAVYLFIINLLGLGLGPLVLPLMTDYVFSDPSQIHLSLLTTTAISTVTAAALLLFGLRSFRESRTHCDRWVAEHSAGAPSSWE